MTRWASLTGLAVITVVVASGWLAIPEGLSILVVAGRFGASTADPLAHDTRAAIVEYVEATPGVTLTGLAEGLDVPLSTVRHHLGILEREDALTSRKLHGNRRFFPVAAGEVALLAALDTPATAAILRVLARTEPATVGDVVAAVGRSYGTVSGHLSRLAEDGLVARTREGRTTWNRLTPTARRALDAGELDGAPGPHEADAIDSMGETLDRVPAEGTRMTE